MCGANNGQYRGQTWLPNCRPARVLLDAASQYTDLWFIAVLSASYLLRTLRQRRPRACGLFCCWPPFWSPRRAQRAQSAMRSRRYTTRARQTTTVNSAPRCQEPLCAVTHTQLRSLLSGVTPPPPLPPGRYPRDAKLLFARRPACCLAEYVLGIRTLIASVRDTGNTEDFLCLLAPSVRQSTRDILKKDGCILRDVSNIDNP